MCIVSKHLEKVLSVLKKCAFWLSVVNYVSRVLKNDMKGLLLVQTNFIVLKAKSSIGFK